jgi:DNA-binding Lrp family transcriptional regulator
MTNSVELDALDHLVIGALLAHPRATHGEIGQAVRTSEATVSSRLSRLLRANVVRVVGVFDDHVSRRARSVFVRLRCRPGTADGVARAIAQWDETGSVKVLTGTVDCVAELTYTSNEHLYRLMMEELPHLDGIVASFSNQVIRRFSTPHSWNPGILSPHAVRALQAERSDVFTEVPEPDTVAQVSPLDERLIAELARDGRLGWQALADRCGVTPSTARKHVGTLMARGILRMRAVVEPNQVGFPVDAFISLSINPTKLGVAGETLAQHRDVLMIAATTGDRNLCGEVAVESDKALYNFLADTIGDLPGLLHADVAVGLRTVKRAGMITG